MRRRIVFLLALVLLQLFAGAADMPMPPEGGFGPPPEGGPGGPGGPGSAGQEFAAFQEIREHAGAYIGGDASSGTWEVPEDSDFAGTIEGGEAFSGFRLTGAVGDNGIAIDLGDQEKTVKLGDAEDRYQMDGQGYSTVINVDAGQGNNEAGYEAVHGVGVAVNSGTLQIDNCYIRSEGPRSTPVYMFATQSPAATSLVVRDSRLEAHSDEIWMPPFKLLAGGARASLLMTRNNSWFYNSQVVSNNWGAISQDSVDAMTYVVNSTGMSTQGGYGAYLTYGMRLYGSELYGGQYGVFMCGESDIVTDRGSGAQEDPEAMGQAAEDFAPEYRDSVIAAPCNALVVHNSLPNLDMVAHGKFEHTRISTDPADLPEAVKPLAADDPFFLPGVDIIGSGAGCGASYFFLRNLYGSLALIRSMNADLTFDGAETKAANGVLLQSVVTYDPPAASGYLTPEQGGSVPGIKAAFLHGEYAGDILHQDYQRPMEITLGAGGMLKGKMVSGTWAAWNDLWSEENLLEAMDTDGHDPAQFGNDAWVEDVQANLIRQEDSVFSGTENLGITLNLEPGSVWQVTGDSALRSLRLEEGAEITAPEGFELTVFVGCDCGNDRIFYGTEQAEQVEKLEPGTYEAVVIQLSQLPEIAESEETPEPDAAAEPAAEISQEPAGEKTESAPAVSPEEAASAREPQEQTPDQKEDSSRRLPILAGIVMVGVLFGLIIISRKKNG